VIPVLLSAVLVPVLSSGAWFWQIWWSVDVVFKSFGEIHLVICCLVPGTSKHCHQAIFCMVPVMFQSCLLIVFSKWLLSC